ncbi:MULTISPECIES: phosphate signaling complex protein PhoU [Glutamicibacter]|uniref:Phosphate-specific transport system accessory protein PhoU n=1 Tax=Glutamicibacter halophytocola TaxID=1933880 RepID=A0A5B8IR48_9MICC|nr:phosphate signaling complex protein PhoU [Glutamicibacter halophytocola]MBF6671824.1 phosphate signaling complex protein PhoU [Glutamicibacter sp. FBE19]ALG28022.1 PhoU family transcriptional regulator [Glutamicibacter halophytocola]NQD40578.1 phosphate signaling complex protein PhoU [Glutamicibacter halophytocola]QDY67361.1 phosphate signaling complex protein PhoU [Glutamicibacter halophytocola]UUX59542.1 phosphate signaling complex protein PhoU [Glutamicibacter halophytocola]
MRKVFQADLQQIGEELIEMANQVATAMDRAWDSLANADVELAQEVIAADAKIDFLQNQLDERAIDTLALQGPVASDLRMIVGSLRMSASLERMGDLARHLAQLARLRFPQPAIPERISATFSEMARIDIQIAQAVARLLDTRDLKIAAEIIELNHEVDRLHSSVFARIAEADWDASAPTTVDVSLTSRYLERFGDHGVSVARKVTYLVTGEWDPSDA